jgi:hypothetical protein
MDTKLIASFKLAGRRFLWGILGTWCGIGPIILLASSGHWLLKLALLLLLVAGYAYVFHIWSRLGLAPIKQMILEARSAICFMIIGLLLSEITGVFTQLKLELSVLYAFIGFFVAVNYARDFTRVKHLLRDRLGTISHMLTNRSSIADRGHDRKF